MFHYYFPEVLGGDLTPDTYGPAAYLADVHKRHHRLALARKQRLLLAHVIGVPYKFPATKIVPVEVGSCMHASAYSLGKMNIILEVTTVTSGQHISTHPKLLHTRRTQLPKGDTLPSMPPRSPLTEPSLPTPETKLQFGPSWAQPRRRLSSVPPSWMLATP